MSSYLDQNGLSRVISKIKDSLNGKLDKSGGTVTGNLAVNGQFTNGGKTIGTIVDEKLASSGQISMSSTEHIVGYLDSYPIYERTWIGQVSASFNNGYCSVVIETGMKFVYRSNETPKAHLISSYGSIMNMDTESCDNVKLQFNSGNYASLRLQLYLTGYSFSSGYYFPYLVTIRYIKL